MVDSHNFKQTKGLSTLEYSKTERSKDSHTTTLLPRSCCTKRCYASPSIQ